MHFPYLGKNPIILEKNHVMIDKGTIGQIFEGISPVIADNFGSFSAPNLKDEEERYLLREWHAREVAGMRYHRNATKRNFRELMSAEADLVMAICWIRQHYPA